MATAALEKELTRLRRELARERSLRKKAENLARSTEITDRIGSSAGEFVHELRNPLAGIEGFAGLAKRGLDPANPAHAHLERIETGVRRANRILTTMSDMARTPDLDRCTVPVDEVVRGALAILSVEHRQACDRTRTALLGPESVHVDSAAAKSALLELLRNAADSGASELRILTEGATPDRIRISVIDNGPGIKDVPRALRLFTTTRPGADGVGLPQAERFALLHGGRLILESQPGQGTTATIEIPCSQEELATRTQERDEP